MASKPLHERLRGLIPKSVEKRIPEGLKPPAWREPEWGLMEATPWAMGGNEPAPRLEFVWGDPAQILTPPEMDYVVVTQDSKGKDLPEALRVPAGTKGKMVGVGPDFVVMQFGDDYPEQGIVAHRFRVPKKYVINLRPTKERKLGRRVVEVSIIDLR